jgi:hypothetical protein
MINEITMKSEEAANLFLVEILAEISTFSDSYNTRDSTKVAGLQRKGNSWVVTITAPKGTDDYASYVNGRLGICKKHGHTHYHYIEDTLDRVLRIVSEGGTINGI